jgi:hypothetical protein
MRTQLDPVSPRNGFSAKIDLGGIPMPARVRARRAPAVWRGLAPLPDEGHARARPSYDAMTFIHRLNIAAAVAAVAFVVILFAVRCVPLLLGECRVSPSPLPFNARVEALIELPKSRPCRVEFNSASAVVNELTLVQKPARGEVVIEKNKAGVIYRPDADFHGDDVFTVLARGTSIRHVDAALVHVSVHAH